VNRDKWGLARRIEGILGAESGASLQELAERTGAGFSEIRTAAGILYAQRRADFCWRYLTSVPVAG
jgi:hypothetical protein